MGIVAVFFRPFESLMFASLPQMSDRAGPHRLRLVRDPFPREDFFLVRASFAAAACRFADAVRGDVRRAATAGVSSGPCAAATIPCSATLGNKRDAWLKPPGATERELKARTLTNLYNARPGWLADAHRTLDESVFAAYGWPATLSDSEVLDRLLAFNLERAAKEPK